MVSEWLATKGLDTGFEALSNYELDKVLQCFFAEVRDRNGKIYMKSSMIGIRYAINRHLQEAPWNKALDLSKGKDFLVSNQVFTGMLKKLKQEGHDTTTHKEAISKEDWEKIWSSGVLDDNNPTGLQRRVFMEIMIHFGRRGREGLCQLKKSSFQICQNEGKEYIKMALNEQEKMKQGTEKIEEGKQAIMSEQQQNCPVASFKKFVSLLNPEEEALFTKPLKNWRTSTAWYSKQKLGANSVGTMMKLISTEAKLSKMYTNHCLRATTATILAQSGVQDRDIANVTGHKNPQSLQHYINNPSIEKKRALSTILHENMSSGIQRFFKYLDISL